MGFDYLREEVNTKYAKMKKSIPVDSGWMDSGFRIQDSGFWIRDGVGLEVAYRDPSFMVFNK